MRRQSSTLGRPADASPTETNQRSAAITAMGYRLAAAGPRTRQRLIERDGAAAAPLMAPPPGPINSGPRLNEPPSVHEKMPALASWDDALWQQRLAADAELGMARLSPQKGGFPLWRSVALLASAACGFSLVLFGQSLHLDRKLRQANHKVTPGLLADMPPPAAAPTPLPPPPMPSLQPEPAPAPVQAQSLAQAAPAPDPVPPHIAERPTPHPALPALAALPHPQSGRVSPRPVLAMTSRALEPKWSEPRPHPNTHATAAHHDLPRWLTEDRPAHERELIMSPPPHNLDAPADAQLAASTPHPASPAAAPKTDLPPIPQPGRRAALIYAEAHTAAPPAIFWAAPRPSYNATPYYAPNPQPYGMPPPTPYYEP